MGRKTKRTSKIAAFIMCVVIGTLSCMTVFAAEVPAQEHSHNEDAICCAEEQTADEQAVALSGEECWMCSYGGTFVGTTTLYSTETSTGSCTHGKTTDNITTKWYEYKYACNRCGYMGHYSLYSVKTYVCS